MCVYLYLPQIPKRKYIPKHLMKMLYITEYFTSLLKLKAHQPPHRQTKNTWTKKQNQFIHEGERAEMLFAELTLTVCKHRRKNMLSMPFYRYAACKYFCTCVHSYLKQGIYFHFGFYASTIFVTINVSLNQLNWAEY